MTLPSMLVTCAMVICFLAYPMPAAALDCSSPSWHTTEKSLQEARRRIKSKTHRHSRNKARCAFEVIDAIGSRSPVTSCAECVREYIGLLKDSIHFARSAAQDVEDRDGNLRAQYLEREIKMRLLFGDYLIKSQDQKLVDSEWIQNFEGLGDAMEMTLQGQAFHIYALGSTGHELSLRSYETWMKAIRSCNQWNFVAGVNVEFKKLRPTLLCEPSCRKALEVIKRRADAHSGMDKAGIVEVLDYWLPSMESCPLEE